MPDYDFTSLSPHDFELLTRDLLQAELGTLIESFKSGRDKGIDLRYAFDEQHNAIIQCKHYVNTGLSGLKSKLKKDERTKISKLDPQEYYLVTSISLTANNKDEIIEILRPYITHPKYILGREDLNNLLGKYPTIEQKHYKLWIGSTQVLKTVLNNDIFSRTFIDIQTIKRRLSLFVPTPAFDRAKKILEERGFCLLSGIPGIGKTTTAEMLVALLLRNGWQCIFLSSGAGEAFKTYDRSSRQLFYYDDFLGQTFFGDKVLGKNEDKDLVTLIKHCSERQKTKRTILTTREYILSQAQSDYENLQRANLNIGQCTVSLKDYTQKIRAQILVNHLYFYNIEEEVRINLVTSGAAEKIIRHPNYSPRIVEWMCEGFIQKKADSITFETAFLNALNDPSDIWRHAFENQISPEAKDVMICLASIGNSCSVDALFTITLTFQEVPDVELAARRPLEKAIAELEGTFLQIDPNGGKPKIRFHNPSVKDFTDNLLQNQPETVKKLTSLSIDFEQISNLATLIGQAKFLSMIDDEMFSSAIERTYQSTVYTKGWQLLVSQRLVIALTSSKDRTSACRRKLAILAHKYLEKSSLVGDSVQSIISLLLAWEEVIATLSLMLEVDRFTIFNKIKDQASELDDYSALFTLVKNPRPHESKEDAKQLFNELRTQFINDIESHQHAADEFESSEEIDSYLEELSAVAEDLLASKEVEDSILSLEECRDEMKDAEDAADMAVDLYEENSVYNFQEMDEVSSSPEINANDILSSLLG